MRKLEIGTEKYTQVFAVDEKAFNANHEYWVEVSHAQIEDSHPSIPQLTVVKFQKGPIKENGVNGCCNEDLIAMVLDRLNSFQESPYKCRENAIAITKLEEALHWLGHRTRGREKRGVEGTSVI